MTLLTLTILIIHITITAISIHTLNRKIDELDYAVSKYIHPDSYPAPITGVYDIPTDAQILKETPNE